MFEGKHEGVGQWGLRLTITRLHLMYVRWKFGRSECRVIIIMAVPSVMGKARSLTRPLLSVAASSVLMSPVFLHQSLKQDGLPSFSSFIFFLSLFLPPLPPPSRHNARATLHLPPLPHHVGLTETRRHWHPKECGDITLLPVLTLPKHVADTLLHRVAAPPLLRPNNIHTPTPTTTPDAEQRSPDLRPTTT